MPETVPVTEPYRDPRQQHDAAMMGMYIFLGSEIMLFGGPFAVAAAMRLAHAAEVVQASQALHFGIGGLNTAALLTSSPFVALAMEAGKRWQGRHGRRPACRRGYLRPPLLVIKACEYHTEFTEGLLPVPGIQSRYATSVQHLFMNLYLVATALHALHQTIDIVLLLVLALQRRGRDTVAAAAIILITAGLYRHLVDVIWVFLYPVFYLAR
ncbi:cytochrome c oxidase polypeptide III [Agrobacterium rhizogenes]|nr:cytochrome c oxidase polypeptide III [Rhizobium rhizogenes]NTH62161.1 cytochrome c oxidase polypeptide III [Rhizobium rhizogenes]NTH93787.1 cytochrome c oxidase polypeptide III [Rhizobium rhizogenes]